MNETILNEYRKKSVFWLLIIIIFSATAAGCVFPVLVALKLYPSVKWISIGIFEIFIVAEDIIGICLIQKCRKEPELSIKTEQLVKWYLVLIQWLNLNLITWFFPSKESWMFAFYFLILMAIFLDMKVIAICSIIDLISLIVLFIANPATRPVEEFFITDSILRAICILLSMAGVIFFSIFINKYMLHAKKEQLERNNEHVMKVLDSVQLLSQKLHIAGTSLSQISENESASAEELAATSEHLTESSNVLSVKTDESMNNLRELNEWESVVADNVKKVEDASKELLDKSMDNENLLNELHTINSEVSETMKTTTDIAQKLSDAVKEIGVTMNLISDISTSTNLLALNASIEAARAGEAGRGFAVVATEVGNLAGNTQETLKEVETVIARVQNNVNEITAQVEENSSKVETQNEYFQKVFESMREMTELLHASVEAVATMGDAQEKQSEVIKNTVSINRDIAENIRNTNEQFEAINVMAENNANDTTEVAEQASAINRMVDEMGQLLKSEEE